MSYLGNLWTALRGGPKAQTFDLANMTPGDLAEFLRIGGSMTTASGAVVNEKSALKVAAAWRCVNIIAGTMGSLPLDLVRRVDEQVREPASGHPLRRVLTTRPNQWQTPAEFKRMMQTHVLLRGNAYAMKVQAAGQVVGLIPLHPDRVEVEQLADYTLRYTATLKDGSQRIMGSADVFHLRGLSLDGVKGLSLLSYMREALGLALVSERAGADMMRNGQVVGGVMKHPGQLTQEAFNRLKLSMDSRRAGGDEAGGTMILEEGMEFQPVSMTAKDLQFLEQRDFQRYDIAMFFGVPPHMIGATDKTTSWGAGIEAQGIGFVTYTLNDWLRIWEEAIKRDLINPREWETLDARFYTQGLMRGDVKARWESYTKGLQWGVMSPNEVRALEDMNPREGGQVFYQPPNASGNGGQDEPQETA